MSLRLIHFLLFCIALAYSRGVLAQDYIPIFSRDYSSRLSVELDPMSFLLKGYSFHVRYQPMFTERFLIGIGTYAMNVPETVLNMNPENRDVGWDVRIRGAYLLTAAFYPKRANHGWFIGEQIGFQTLRVINDGEFPGAASLNNLLLLTHMGYSWHPWKGSFFVKPWIGLGFNQMIDGTNEVGGKSYDLGPWSPFFTIHLGYSF